MYRIEWFDVVGDNVNELCHDGFDPCRISSHVSGTHENSIQAFVVWTDTQALPRGPLGTGRIEGFETMVTKAMRQVHDPGLDSSLDSLEHDPVGGTKPFEWSTPHEFDRSTPVIGMRRP